MMGSCDLSFKVALIKFLFSNIMTKTKREDGSMSVFRVHGPVHFLISLWHNLIELSNQDAEGEVRRWGGAWLKLTGLSRRRLLLSVTVSVNFPPVGRRDAAQQSHRTLLNAAWRQSHPGCVQEQRGASSTPESRVHPPSQTFEKHLFSFTHTPGWRFSLQMLQSTRRRRERRGRVRASQDQADTATDKDGLCRLTSSQWRLS